MESANINVRVDSDLKKQAESLFADLGLTMSSAITLFLKSAVGHDGIPFDVKRCKPNSITVSALKEHEKMISDKETYKRYNSFAEILAEVSDDA